MSPVYSPPKRLTFEEYLTCIEDSGCRYELLDTGELIELSNENDINVILAMALAEYLKQFVSWRFLRLNTTAIQVTPMSVTLENGRTRRIRQQSRIPDLMVLTEQGAKQIFGKPSGLALHHDNPMLIVEFVSPSDRQANSDEDYTDKRAQYEERGIPEYWIADRHRQQITVLCLQEGQYVKTLYQSSETLRSEAFPTLKLTAADILTVEEL